MWKGGEKSKEDRGKGQVIGMLGGNEKESYGECVVN